jgi:LPXTG-motif cell wall-anchored protein
MKAPLPATLMVVLVLLLAAPTRASAQGTDPGSVVAAFDAALNAGNVEATLALFADDAVVRTQSATYTGRQQLRGLFTELVGDHFQFESSNSRVVGDTETHAAKVSRDAWRRLGIAPLDATAEVVVQSGKIRSFTVTYTPESLARLQAAQARAAAPPAQVPSALPRTGDVLSPVPPLLAGGSASLLAGLALLRRRR